MNKNLIVKQLLLGLALVLALIATYLAGSYVWGEADQQGKIFLAATSFIITGALAAVITVNLLDL